MQKERDSKPSADEKPDVGKWPGVRPTNNIPRLTLNRCFLLAGLYCCNTLSGSTRTVSTLDNTMPCHRTSGGKRDVGGWKSQVLIGTRFAVNKDEVIISACNSS